MYFTKALALFSLAASAMAMPVATDAEVDKRASASVLSTRTYANFQVSDGVGGNALAEVQAKFPIDESNLAGVSASDLSILNAARVTAEAAEVNTGGFNDAISKAGSSTAAGKALQVGKIKNKVLKLKLEVLVLQIEQAQNGQNNAAKIAAEQTKLDTNIKIDTSNKGLTSQSVNFAG